MAVGSYVETMFFDLINHKKKMENSAYCVHCNEKLMRDCFHNKNTYGIFDPKPVEIYPGLWLGSLDYLSTDFIEDKKFIINCTERPYELDSLTQILHCPALDIRDFPIIEKYGESAYQFTKFAKSCGQKTYIHCLMGHNRSATLACYVIWRLSKQPIDEIIRKVITLRPCTFTNESFIKKLLEICRGD